MAELTVREGDGDAARTGYWIVTGPQPEDDAYATVELARILPDREEDDVRFAYRWYLHKRVGPSFNSSASYMRTVASGEAPVLEESVDGVRVAWAEHIGLTVAVDDEQTAPISRPWRT